MSDMLFVFAGLGLILLEMLVIPGFGIVGLGGIGFMLYGLYLLLLRDMPVGEEIMEEAMGISKQLPIYPRNDHC